MKRRTPLIKSRIDAVVRVVVEVQSIDADALISRLQAEQGWSVHQIREATQMARQDGLIEYHKVVVSGASRWMTPAYFKQFKAQHEKAQRLRASQLKKAARQRQQERKTAAREAAEDSECDPPVILRVVSNPADWSGSGVLPARAVRSVFDLAEAV
jgi:hypothetical protein